MKSFFQRWIILTLAVLVAAQIVPGINYGSASGLLIATLLLGILNAFVRPVMMFLSFPLLILTLGLFTLVINGLLLYWVGHVIKDFHVTSFSAAFFGALIVSIVSMMLNILTGNKKGKGAAANKNSDAAPPRDDGQGPVIDV
jgi:putative membrane protein